MIDVMLAALPVFLASIVEVVEAFTITLAVGVTRGWKSALFGMGFALFLLIGAAWLVGPTLVETVDEHILELVIGVLLLLFGVRWLRKAVLRYGGVVPLHDEARVFESEVSQLAVGNRHQQGIDWPGFFISFKGMLLEGLEIVFLVLTLGALGDSGMVPATFGAVGAFVLVAIVVAVIRRPLTRVPENTLKFAVGAVITTFGVFWTVEGLGGSWPGGAVALAPLFGAMLIWSWFMVRVVQANNRFKVGSPQNA